jgi:hypothetical protein
MNKIRIVKDSNLTGVEGSMSPAPIRIPVSVDGETVTDESDASKTITVVQNKQGYSLAIPVDGKTVIVPLGREFRVIETPTHNHSDINSGGMIVIPVFGS